ncbi:MAG: 30S ribosomal protein S16 [Actinobacteria bacterium]|nr:30S ribosomal protein S16 [Actinomycetota bacterium]
MAVKLRLMRVGKTKQPTYRVVAADARSPRDGRFIEIVGTYQPRHEPSTILIEDEKVLRWLREGAQPTETVEKLLRISGTWEQFKPGDPPRVHPAKPEPAKAAEPLKAEAPAAEPEAAAAEPETPASEAAEPEAETAAEATETDAS